MDNDSRSRKVQWPNPNQTMDSTHSTNAEDKVDEKKIEQEFGLPADLAEASHPKPHKLLLLLPNFKSYRSKHKHSRLILISIIVLIILAGLSSLTILHFYQPTYAAVSLPKKVVRIVQKPTTVPSTLTGLQVAPSVNQRPVTAVMIENSVAARPQSGLNQAGVVFEALTEGGITRFMAFYQDTQPNYIGPVRSIRPYYIQWALGFDAAIAHVGGSPLGLSDMAAFHAVDLNQFYNANAYERIKSRVAPHNVYTSISQLNQIEASKGLTTSSYTGFPRTKATPSANPNVTSININFSYSVYNVSYAYNSKTNSYERSEGGAPHMELSSNGSEVQIAPQVVIAMVLPYSLGPLDSSNAYYSVYGVIGSGPVYIFQDGTVETGIWTKASNTSQITFTNSNGQTIPLIPGQTWISALANSQELTYN